MDEFAKSVPQLCQSMIKTAANVITCMDDHEHESKKILNNLRDNLEKFCKNTEKYKKVNETSRMIVAESEENRMALLDKYCENIDSYDPDVADNEYLKEYDDRVAALMKSTIGKSQNDASNDGELQITQGNNINLICPISKCKMTEPMENTICGHVYDKSSVISMLNINKQTRCPIVGCSNKEYLNLKDLKCDIVTQMRMETNDE